jgi:hypothetical protein
VSWFTKLRDFGEQALGGSAVAGVVGGTLGGFATGGMGATLRTIGGAVIGLSAAEIASVMGHTADFRAAEAAAVRKPALIPRPQFLSGNSQLPVRRTVARPGVYSQSPALARAAKILRRL